VALGCCRKGAARRERRVNCCRLAGITQHAAVVPVHPRRQAGENIPHCPASANPALTADCAPRMLATYTYPKHIPVTLTQHSALFPVHPGHFAGQHLPHCLGKLTPTLRGGLQQLVHPTLQRDCLRAGVDTVLAFRVCQESRNK
jgi:hypothetical protein